MFLLKRTNHGLSSLHIVQMGSDSSCYLFPLYNSFVEMTLLVKSESFELAGAICSVPHLGLGEGSWQEVGVGYGSLNSVREVGRGGGERLAQIGRDGYV